MRTRICTALAALLLLATASPAPAADRQTRSFDWTLRSASVTHRWSEQSKPWPQRCRLWTKGEGRIVQEAGAASGTLTAERFDSGWYAYRDAKLRGSLERVVGWRHHLVPQVRPCVPCDTEYGRCDEAPRPDDDYVSSCGPRDETFGLHILISGRGLYWQGGVDSTALQDCPQFDYRRGDAGPSADIYVERTAIPGMGAALLRLRVGAERRVNVLRRAGRCSRINSTGIHSCVVVRAQLVFRRTR
ncbi:hypothetical protein Q5424_17700 [Conexibacter sp. JD483]|uniref:hypothetical protein n=1 Tax=unclassified Conexibacter TaxID=2627773 RepID=UPI00271FCE59|nr:MULTISPECIES: hypothetical protein [unclassified Conexibacter]MDO8188720.1 hypothetical protein [Conexibacter sp. CPCC 205706]MDO8201247.1 hypothetical protein [Conexibacter sp. CPCC 205762]MDR9370935.1 hypothetical protein [Conexibacter sp. JD483]